MKGYICYPGVDWLVSILVIFQELQKSPDIGGLGFDYKWDFRVDEHTLKYMKLNLPIVSMIIIY